MEQNIFLSQVKQYIDCMNKDNIKRCLLDVAKQIPKESTQAFLQCLQNYSSDKEEKSDEDIYKSRMSDQLVEEKRNEILIWMDSIDNHELYLDADGYEDYSGGYWNSDWTWDYSDPMGIGTKIEMAVAFVKDCVNDRKYEVALNILDRILDLEVSVETDGDEMSLDIEQLQEESIIKIDLKQLALIVLYVDYQVRDKKERAADIYTYFGYSFFRNIHMEEIRHIGREELKDEAVFWEDWIEILSSKMGDLEARLLKEAVIYSKGADGLAEIARKNYMKHPSLYLEALNEYEMNHEYQKMVDIGTEAVSIIDKKYRIRGKIALKASCAEFYLGHEDKMKELWYEVYVSDMNEVNFLRLFLEDNMAQSYGMKGKDLPKIPKKENGNGNCNLELVENLVDSTTATYLAFFSGEFQKVKKACVNPTESLGWSGRFIGYGIKIFLLYLYNEECLGKATKNIAHEIARSFGFKENEEFYYLKINPSEKNGGDSETFWMAFCKWKNYFTITSSEKNKYLHWLEEIIDKRTNAIVGGQFRNHYAGVALLISALGEVKESMGYQGARQEIKAKYKKMFPRHSSFNAAVNEYI